MAVATQQQPALVDQHPTTNSSNADLYNPGDFCNSFWGTGDDGVNILFSRMRVAAKTTEELKDFWSERSAIEEQYATRLANLAKGTITSDETGELRHSLDVLRHETKLQAEAHFRLASLIHSELESPTSVLHAKQTNLKRNVQAAIEKKFKLKQSQEAYVAKAKEKYEGDCLRIASYTQQLKYAQGKDLEKIELKLKRARQTVQANEKDLANFSRDLQKMMPGWEKDWKDFCDTCQDLEEERLEFTKDILWAYANGVSTLCVSDDESCERIRTVLDQFEADRDIETFVVNYGTGNLIPEPRLFAPASETEPQGSSSSTSPPSKQAKFRRVSRRQAPLYQPTVDLRGGYQPLDNIIAPVPHDLGSNGRERDPPEPQAKAGPQPTWADSNQQQAPQQQQWTSNHTTASTQVTQSQPSRSREEATQAHNASSKPSNGMPPAPPETYPSQVETLQNPPSRRQSQPLPKPNVQQTRDRESSLPPPPPQQSQLQQPQEQGRILFYVKALYDYQATIDEEFDFQAGDVIAVTATPEDGWWSGELLDENRRVEGRHVFPSNFVCLF